MASSWLRSVASRANDIVAETAAAVFEDTDSDYSGSSDGYYEEVEGEEPDGAAAAAARTGGREGAVGVSGQSPRGKGQRPVPGQTLRTEDPLGRGGGGGGIPEKGGAATAVAQTHDEDCVTSACDAEQQFDADSAIEKSTAPLPLTQARTSATTHNPSAAAPGTSTQSAAPADKVPETTRSKNASVEQTALGENVETAAAAPTLSRVPADSNKTSSSSENITPEAPSTAASPEPSSLASGPSETAEASSVPRGSIKSNVSDSVVRGTAAYGTAPTSTSHHQVNKATESDPKNQQSKSAANNSHHLLQILLHRQLPLLKCSVALCPLES